MVESKRTYKPRLETLEERWCPAKPGAGGTEPASTIHYAQFQIVESPFGTNENFVGYRSMKGDGANKLASPHYEWRGEPSRQLHGTRWILAAEFIAGTYPNGQPRSELFATREDTGVKVQLTDNPNIQVDYGYGLRWAFDDSFVSFAAVTWTTVTSGGNYTDAGGGQWLADAEIFRASVDWSSGAPVVAAPAAMLDAGLYFESGGAVNSFYVRPDVLNLDWSPNGTKLAYEQITVAANGVESHTLQITSFDAGGNSTGTLSLGAGIDPEWAFDGSRVAFSASVSGTSSNRAIWTAKPDGSGRLRVTNPGTNGTWDSDYDPKWSPDLDSVTAGYQGHIAFTRSKQSNQQGSTSWLRDVMRVPSAGGTPINLTKDLADNVYATAWRAGSQVIPGSPLLAASIGDRNTGEALDSNGIQPLLSEALSRWQAAGFDVSGLNNIDIRIADLGGATLGLASGNTIWLDDNAAGWGWFVDPTPSDDSEFTTPGNQGEQNRIDLLTVLSHEIGHLLGHDHEEDGVMAETLSAGTRLTLHGVDVQESWWLAGLPDDTRKRDAFSWWL